MRASWTRLLAVLASLKLTLVCLAASMVLILLATFAQTDAGIYYVKKVYFDTFIVWWNVPTGWGLNLFGDEPVPLPGGFRLPVFPGGFTVGAVLLANLIAAHVTRFSMKAAKIGIFLTHAGLILLIAGMFFSSILTVESRLEIDEGASKNWTEDYQLMELVVIDTSNPDYDEVVSFPQSMLDQPVLHHDRLPFDLRVHRYMANAHLVMADSVPEAAPLSEKGFGTTIAGIPAPVERSQDKMNFTTVVVEPMIGQEGFGTYALSNGFTQPEIFALSGRTYVLQVRPQRYYLPYTLTLNDFKHDRYPGTEIPKNFSSQVTLTTEQQPSGRDHLIYMNEPLRHDGKTFYQAQFKNNELTSILQVVDNPGWTIPYISCSLIAAGLLVHFLVGLSRFLNRRSLAT